MLELPNSHDQNNYQNVVARRVSDSAEETLGKILEQWAEKVAIQAVAFAKHAGRKIVYASDI